MFWMTAALAANLEVLGAPAFRAPDGIVDAAIALDGRVWTLSARGEVAGFSPEGVLLTTFQACPDRGERVEFTLSGVGNRLGLACATDYRVYDLPTGALRQVFDVDTTHAALSDDGRLVGILGERYAGDVSEDESWLLVYDVRSGEITRTVLGEYDRVEPIQRGWVLARGNDAGTSMSLFAIRREPGGAAQTWTHEVDPKKLAGGGWTTELAFATRQRGQNVCIAHEGGGTCLGAADARPSRPWSPVDRPFIAPAEGAIVRSASGRYAYEVLSTHLRTTPEGWTRPVQVVAGGERLLVVDDAGRVFDARTGEKLAVTTGPIALSSDGRWLWTPTVADSVRRDLDGSATDALPALDFAHIEPDGTVYGLQAHPDGGAMLVEAAPGGSVEELGRLPKFYTPSGLRVADGKALVSYDQDDRWITFPLADPTDPATLVEGRHAFGLGGDIVLAGGEVLHTDETGPERTFGTAAVDASAIVRILPDGTGFVELLTDRPRLVLKSRDGSTIEAVNLPGRGDAAWAFPGKVVVALRDGRLAVLTRP